MVDRNYARDDEFDAVIDPMTKKVAELKIAAMYKEKNPSKIVVLGAKSYCENVPVLFYEHHMKYEKVRRSRLPLNELLWMG